MGDRQIFLHIDWDIENKEKKQYIMIDTFLHRSLLFHTFKTLLILILVNLYWTIRYFLIKHSMSAKLIEKQYIY